MSRADDALVEEVTLRGDVGDVVSDGQKVGERSAVYVSKAGSITDPKLDESTLPHEFHQISASSKYRRLVKREPIVEGMTIFGYKAQAHPSVDQPAQPASITREERQISEQASVVVLETRKDFLSVLSDL